MFIGTSTISWSVRTHMQIEKLEFALSEYKADCEQFPSVDEGLIELVESRESCWKGPYVLNRQLFDLLSKQ